MSVVEKKIKVNSKIRPYKKYEPPESSNPFLPKLWFSLLSSSAKNTGKTYNIIQLLTAYENSTFTQDGEKCVMRTIWMSGSTATSKNNAIIRTLKSLAPEDIYDITKDNVGKLQEVYSDCLNEKQEIEKYVEYEQAFKRWQEVGEDKLTELELLILDERDFVAPRKLLDKPKYKRPRVIFMVFDDLLNNPLVFGYKRANFINQTIILHRHDSPDRVPINMLLISQSFKSVPTLVRKQIDYFILLRNANKRKLLENITEEVGGIVGMKDLEKLYDYAMSVEYGALIVSIHPADKINFRLSWDKQLTLDDTPCDCESKGKPFGSCGKTK